MTQSATLSHAQSDHRSQGHAAVHPSVEADPGPWLLFVMPVSFALTVLVVSWLSTTSF